MAGHTLYLDGEYLAKNPGCHVEVEHLEDYLFSFLRQVKVRSRYKIFHIPLDLSVQTLFRKNGLSKRREMYAHLHYFTKQTALRTLSDTGYEVLDYFYTPRSIECASAPGEKMLQLPGKLSVAIQRFRGSPLRRVWPSGVGPMSPVARRSSWDA